MLNRPRRKRCLILLPAILWLNNSLLLADSPPSFSIINIGLTDSPLHVDPTGYAINAPIDMNAGGQILGYAFRFSGTDNTGDDTWIYNPSSNTSTTVGLSNAAHDGQNSGMAINDNGFAIGIAQLNDAPYDPTITPYDGWLYSPVTQTTQMIGLADDEHTQTGGYHQNTPRAINDAGQVDGTAERFNGNTAEGTDAWFYDPSVGTAQVIGPTGPDSTDPTGYRYNDVVAMNNAGQVVGSSLKYNGATWLGQETWLYDSASSTTSVIGLTDAAHTGTNGETSNIPVAMNSGGQVIGYAGAYVGEVNRHTDAWEYNPTSQSSQMIGLYDSAHRASDGSALSWPVALNNGGQVVGYASRYIADTYAGRDAWEFNPANQTTKIIGLIDAAHTNSDGYYDDEPTLINASGMVAGNSNRYQGDTYLGNDSWIYDPSNDENYTLSFSVSSDGYANSVINSLNTTGVALGDYELFDGSTDLGERAFYWSESTGFEDLGALIDGGLAANGWTSLTDAFGINGSSTSYGYGVTNGPLDSAQAYVLNIAVPEPVGLSFIVLSALAGSGRRRRS
jgi:hypothetical protein